MSAPLVTAWIIIELASAGPRLNGQIASESGRPILAKQVRIDPVACHLPAVRADYRVDGQWRPVRIRITCSR